jgi:hypothetical protein
MGCLCYRGRKKKAKSPTAALHRRGNYHSRIKASQGGAANGEAGSRDGDMVVMTTDYGAAVLAATAISATAASATFASDGGGGGGGGCSGGGGGGGEVVVAVAVVAEVEVSVTLVDRWL